MPRKEKGNLVGSAPQSTQLFVQSTATKERSAQLEQYNCKKGAHPSQGGQGGGRRAGRGQAGRRGEAEHAAQGLSSPWGSPFHLLPSPSRSNGGNYFSASLLEQSKMRPTEGFLALCEENLRAISGCLHHYSVVCLALTVDKGSSVNTRDYCDYCESSAMLNFPQFTQL